MFKVIFGAIIGGIIASVWGVFSWFVLPWNDVAVNKFRNQEFVAWVIKENVTTDGVYIAPYHEKSDVTSSGVKQEKEQREAVTKTGPFVFAQVKVGGVNMNSPLLHIYSFLTQFTGAFLIGMLLMSVVDTNYVGRLFFVTMIGLIIGVIGLIPNWIWYGAGYRFTLIMMAYHLIQWFLVGVFMAGFVKPRKEREHELKM